MKLIILYLLTLGLVTTSCNSNNSRQANYQPPKKADDGLKVGTLEEAQIDSRYIIDAIGKIHKGRYNDIHSLLIYKDGKLVAEEYFEGYTYKWDEKKYRGDLVQWNKEMSHPIMSCTKSFMSACIGIAIDKGFIESAQQSIFDYLPKHQHLKSNNREYITIEHLLTMTSGLAWDEWSAPHGGALTNDIDHLWLVEDQISTVLERQWWAVPGDFFTYNGGGMIILGEILKNATGMNVDKFSMQYLFEPLHIKNAEWTQYPSGIFDTGGSLKITPREMIKLGVTYLNEGIWNGKRILSANWIAKSSAPFKNNNGIRIPIEDSGENGYAYSWWTSQFFHNGQTINMYRANGWGGQAIMVFPELDMVVVCTGGNYAKNSKLYKLARKYIVPSIKNQV